MKKLAFLLSLFTAATMMGAAEDNRIPAKGYAVFEAGGKFQPYEFTRPAMGDDDILMEIEYSAICHSDIHRVRGDWGTTRFPLIPGHEMVGKVSRTGKNVTKFKVGDYAGVGAIINSCGQCDYCNRGEEQYCAKKVITFAARDHFHNNEYTQGGFADNIVVNERYAVKVPEGADVKRIAPLMCAGITVYSPLQFTKVRKGDKIAVAGFGGLGHMALKYAVQLGARVTVFDISEEKRRIALDMGAEKYVNVTNPAELTGMKDTFRVILNTIPAAYDPVMYLNMLQMDGDFIILGIPALEATPSLNLAIPARMGRKKIYGSQMGGMPEMQEMVDFSVAHNIYPDVEIIPIQKLDDAVQNVIDGKVKFRYVIDMNTLK